MHLEAPDPLASVPARYLSAEGFAERLLRLIDAQLRAGAAPDVTLSVVQARCAQLVWGDDDGRDD